MRKLSSLLLALLATITFANAAVYNGTCGTNLTWLLNTEDSTLTIEGTGAMNNWKYNAPWNSYRATIKNVVLPEGLTSIGDYAFYLCSNLISVEIPDGVKTIGERAFNSCENLTSIRIPNSVTSIGNYAFSQCWSIGSLSVPNSVISIGTNAFGYIHNVIYSGTASGSPWNAQCINGYIEGFLVFQNSYKTTVCSCLPNAIGEIVIPQGVTYIKSGAFRHCTGITTVSIPEGITCIEALTFAGCAGLTSMSIPQGVTKLTDRAFSSCTSLANIILPNSLTYIDEDVFYQCSGLLTVTIPANVSHIGKGCFNYCSGLTSITCECITPPVLNEEDFSYFYEVDHSIPVYVPGESIDAYKAADQWKEFTNIRPIGNVQIVRFLDWDGSEIAKILVPNGSAATPPADPTRTGYTFVGWDKDFSNVTEDMTITAQYEINRYKVDFVDWDGTLLKSDSVEYLSTITPPADPERSGYTFTGWDKTVNEVVQDTTITALYDINYYPVVLLGHDGKLLSKQTVAYKHAAQQPEVPAREGYTFSGWSTDIESILDSTYAIALYDKIGGTVTYLSEAGDVIASENVDLHLPAAPIIAGKSFKGWLTESADSENGIVLRATYTSDNPTTSEDVTVTPTSNSADVSFPFITGALTYELVIRDMSGNVVCKIMFNANGQLLGIAFAPSRNRAEQQATQSTGFNFTVEGLNASTTYNYEFVAYDDTDDVIETLSGSFTTTDETPTGNEVVSHRSYNRKYIESGHLFIDNNNRTFDARGQQVR